MKFQKITFLALFLFMASFVHAQWTGASTANPTDRTGSVGIGTTGTNTDAKLSVDGGSSSGANHYRAIYGTILSGSGFTYGVQGTALAPNPSNAGRAYGVYGQAGNATSGANYGVYAHLRGSNAGTAILGRDEIGFPAHTGLTGNKTWAGYFIGNVEVTNAVGIGCTDMSQPAGGSGNQTYRLFVDGGIVGREILIQNGGNWCDYVFEQDYDLKSLEDVEQHIQEKGHLHNTPSAAEIKANEGFEIGETILNQQEKIEEIFLHLIDLKKEMKTLKAENKALKAQLETQK